MIKIGIGGIALTMLSACGNGTPDYDATGTFEATEVIVSAEAAGKLLNLDIEEGKRLQTGEEIGLVDTLQLYLKKLQLEANMKSVESQRPDLAKQIAATKQQIATAEREKKRVENLLTAGAANQKQLDVTLYLVVCLFFIALFFSYAYPLVMGRIPGMKGSLLSFVLVLLIISPFLCAIIMKKNNSVEFRKLWADNRFNRGLLVSMIVIKVLICIIIVMGIIIRLFNVALGSGLILSFLIIVVIYFSKRIRKRSLSMEKQFLENFQGTAGTFPQEEPETGETSTEKNHELSNK